MDSVGTLLTKRPIRLRSFSTRREWSFSRRSAIVTAIACPHKMPWTTFPRINGGLRREFPAQPSSLRNTQAEHANLSQSSSIPPDSPIGALPVQLYPNTRIRDRRARASQGPAFNRGVDLRFWDNR